MCCVVAVHSFTIVGSKNYRLLYLGATRVWVVERNFKISGGQLEISSLSDEWIIGLWLKI